MTCPIDRNLLLEHAYGETEGADALSLTAHLRDCLECRDQLEQISSARLLLREAEPIAPSAPRVVVLGRTSGWNLVWGFASGLACAVLLVLLTLRFGGRPDAIPVFPASGPHANDAWENSVRTLIDQRLERERAEIRSWLVDQQQRPMVTKEDLDAALARLDRRVDGRRASDLDLLLQEMSAMEDRTGRSIGQTRQALKYVALASNPEISAQ